MNKIKLLVTILVIVVLIGAGVLLIKKRKAQLLNEKTPEKPVYLVNAYIPQEGSITLNHQFLGFIKPVNQQVILPKKTAIIQKIYVDIGEKVKKGKLLVKLDSSDINYQINSLNIEIKNTSLKINSLKEKQKALKEELKTKENTYKRDLKLFKNDAISKEKLEKSLTALKLAKANLVQVKNQIKQLENTLKQLNEKINFLKNELKYYQITALKDGVVQNILLREGSIAPAGKPILLLEADGYQVDIRVPLDFNIKEKAKILLKTQKGYIPLKFDTVYPSSQENLKVIRGLLDEKSKNVTSNSYHKVIIQETVKGTILPVNAVFSLSNKEFILVYTNNRFKKLPVTVLGRNEKFIVIKEKLKKLPVAVADESKLRLLSFGAKGKIILRGKQNEL